MIVNNNFHKYINYKGQNILALNTCKKTEHKDVVCFSSRPKEFDAVESYKHLFNLCCKQSKLFFGQEQPYSKEIVERCFLRQSDFFNTVSELCDKDINSVLVDKGYTSFLKCAQDLYTLKRTKNFDILKKSLKCKNTDGKQLNQNEKFQILNLISAYRTSHLSISDFEKMTEDGIIDIHKLKEKLLVNILKNVCGSGFEKYDDCSIDKCFGWNTDYIQFLPRMINKNKFDFEQLFELSKSKDDFKTLLHDESTSLGKANIKTKQMFEENGLDYDKWLNYPQKITVKLDNSEFRNKKILENAVKQSELYLSFFYNTPVKTFLEKKYPQFIKNDKFVIPDNIRNNKKDFQKFLVNFLNNLDPVWKRATNNLESKDIFQRKKAGLCLNVKCALFDIIKKDLNQLPEKNEEDVFDFTIKMWDRVPQKDLFQGNYSTCCIGIGSSNEKAMFKYLENTAFNMIEIIDNNTRQTIGNALCYYAIDEDCNPAFVVDNIEINNKYQLLNNSGRKLRDGLVEYIKTVNKEICKKDVPIYLGLQNNDLPSDDLPKQANYLSVLGAFEDDEKVYVDLYNGWKRPDELSGEVGMYKLN